MMIMRRRCRTSAGPDCDRLPDFQGMRLQTAATGVYLDAMGAPMFPSMPRKWWAKCDLREVPGAPPGMESEVAHWIDELQAWIAEDAEHAELLREALGPEARILLGSVLMEGGGEETG